MMVSSTHVVYAVIARCPGESYTSLTSHELFEAATDPYFYTQPAYRGLDDPLVQNGISNEVGDLCEGTTPVTPTDVGYPVQRIWSNASSMAGHSPCAPTTDVYFDTVVGAADVVSFDGTTMRGVALAPGQTRTVELIAFSDSATTPWTVAASASSAESMDEPALTLCRKSAQNGESIPLTLTRPASSTQGSAVYVTSTLGSVSVQYGFYVGDAADAGP